MGFYMEGLILGADIMYKLRASLSCFLYGLNIREHSKNFTPAKISAIIWYIISSVAVGCEAEPE